MTKSSDKKDKRSASKKLVDAFFEQQMDVALKPFSDFLLTDFTRVMNEFQEFAQKQQKCDMMMLSKIGFHDPDSLDSAAKEVSYDLQEVINRFIRNLRNARIELIEISASTALFCFKGAK